MSKQVYMSANGPINFDTVTTLQMPKLYNYEPLPDITAYELALIFHIVIMHPYYRAAAVEGLPENARRHFRVEE